jgi:hypothetical protein
MFKTWYVFLGFVVGMIIASLFVPPTSNLKMLPHPKEPNRVFKNPKVENGFFQVKCIEVPCTSETDSLNLMSELHNIK